jgi:putative ABC transport system permease protein
VNDISTLEARTRAATFVQRMAGTFVGAFGVLALALAAIGIYGLISYNTRQRTHEIGIRMALGAQQADVLRMILRQGMWLAGIGLALGVVLSLLLGRLMSSLIFGVSARDPLTFCCRNAAPGVRGAAGLLPPCAPRHSSGSHGCPSLRIAEAKLA